MLVVMKPDATDEEVKGVLERLKEANLEGHLSTGEERVVIGAVGVINDPEIRPAVGRMSGVDEVIAISRPYKLTGREFQAEDSVIDVGGVKIGDGKLVVMAGPCSIESEEHMVATARACARRRRSYHSRRRLQAAHLALLLPRARRNRSPAPRNGARRDRAAGDHRGDVGARC